MSLLFLTLTLALSDIILAQTNFFQFKNPSVHNNEAWGQYCFDISTYVPSCGWRLIVSSSYPLYSVSAWDSTQERRDSYSFYITNVYYNADYASSPPTSCADITLGGAFGGVEPEIFVGWYCVCTHSPTGCEIVPFMLVTPYDATPAPTSTTVTVPETTQVAPTSSSNVGGSAYQLATGRGKIFLQKKEAVCYTGSSVSVIGQVRDRVDCAKECRGLASCEGVNYWRISHQCDLVSENTDLNPGSLVQVMDCSFWKVIWKA